MVVSAAEEEEEEEDQVPTQHQLVNVGRPGVVAQGGAPLERALCGNPVKTAAFARDTQVGCAGRCAPIALYPTELGNVNALEEDMDRNLNGAGSRRIFSFTRHFLQ